MSSCSLPSSSMAWAMRCCKEGCGGHGCEDSSVPLLLPKFSHWRFQCCWSPAVFQAVANEYFSTAFAIAGEWKTQRRIILHLLCLSCCFNSETEDVKMKSALAQWKELHQCRKKNPDIWTGRAGCLQQKNCLTPSLILWLLEKSLRYLPSVCSFMNINCCHSFFYSHFWKQKIAHAQLSKSILGIARGSPMKGDVKNYCMRNMM